MHTNWERDPSCVFHRDMLDPEYRPQFTHPWIFETPGFTETFETEDEACTAQRAYRKINGFDKMTGERL